MRIYKRKWNDEDLINAFKTSTSMAEIIKKLNLAVAGGTYGNIQKHLNRLGLNFKDSVEIRQLSGFKRHQFTKQYTDEQIFTENSNVVRGIVRARLLKSENIKYECEKCKIKDWNNNYISLELDHINGIRNDNRIENLRWLCPNCHSQTDTYGGKNKINYGIKHN